MQGQICDILRPQLAMNHFLPLWPHRFLHFIYTHLGGGGVGGALILDRCRAFDLFASVDAHLWWYRNARVPDCTGMPMSVAMAMMPMPSSGKNI